MKQIPDTYDGEPSHLIHTIRNKKVILDADLAYIYGVPTKALNQAVKRNSQKFPSDFIFKLTATEMDELNRSQIVTGSSSLAHPAALNRAEDRSKEYFSGFVF